LVQAVARKLRLEYAGAIYHVISRRKYRRDVFETAPGERSPVRMRAALSWLTTERALRTEGTARSQFSKLRRAGVSWATGFVI
jgi:hypothetical protein